ncbi:MAG: dihydrofolate reductase family protein [Terracidiphilus sp.]
MTRPRFYPWRSRLPDLLPTTFYFVTRGFGGGASTVRQYLQAGQIDSPHLASVPVLLGQGELLFDSLETCVRLGFP